MTGCQNCGHPKWTHYRLFKACLSPGCTCSGFKRRPFRPYEKRT